MVTVLSAQVTQACCPYEDPNCGVPTTCDQRCAPVFANFWESCQSFIDVRAGAVFYPVAPLPLGSAAQNLASCAPGAGARSLLRQVPSRWRARRRARRAELSHAFQEVRSAFSFL